MNRQNLYIGFYNAIKESYFKYLLFGDRSEEKLKPLHAWVGNTIKMVIPDLYDVYFLNGKEVQTEGEYYTKIIDVAIVRKEVKVIKRRVGFKSVFYIPEIEMAVSIKFITSNFKQNANNYFENLLGECANLRARGIKFGHFVVFRDKIPYFERGGKIRNWEILNDDDINKYIKLFQAREKFFHAPNLIGIEIININPIVEEAYNKKPKFTKEEISEVIRTGRITIQNGIWNTKLSNEVTRFILDNFNLFQFFRNINNIVNK
ncbi:hypothetical protein H5T88_07965 [bacterium]|nr:hypothetical protein [bacterium]